METRIERNVKVRMVFFTSRLPGDLVSKNNHYYCHKKEEKSSFPDLLWKQISL